MFEKYSGPARRVVFFARLEAGQSGSDKIEPKHLLLGLLAEDQREWAEMGKRFGDESIGDVRDTPSFFSGERAENLRKVLADSQTARVAIPDSMDMPLAETSRRILLAAKERAGHSTVGLLHLLWGLISDEEDSVCVLLKLNGVTVEHVEDAIRNMNL